MATGKFISYLRVSTDKQGKSGLGLEAQREAVTNYLNGGCWQLFKEYLEIETGKRADRPKLIEALHHAKVTGATLVIAKIDRRLHLEPHGERRRIRRDRHADGQSPDSSCPGRGR